MLPPPVRGACLLTASAHADGRVLLCSGSVWPEGAHRAAALNAVEHAVLAYAVHAEAAQTVAWLNQLHANRRTRLHIGFCSHRHVADFEGQLLRAARHSGGEGPGLSGGGRGRQPE
jgi:hypothetical protein